MKDDPLETELGRVEREAQQIPERWLALVEGRATRTEVEALCREAESDDAAALLWARFRPLDELEQRAIAAKLAASVRGRRRRWAIGSAAGLAAAAAAIVLFAALAPARALPSYQLEVATPAELPIRGTVPRDSGLPEYRRDSALDLILRPVSRTADRIAVDTSLSLPDGRVLPWEPPLQVSPAGAIRVNGTIAELLPGILGQVTLSFVVRREGEEQPAQALSYALRVRGE